VQSAVDGYHVSLFAYGQTGSGKTHTMFGTGADVGIIPRSMAQILQAVRQHEEQGWKYDLQASFVEIYMENVRDLLTPEADRVHTLTHPHTDTDRHTHTPTHMCVWCVYVYMLDIHT
jgi:kinesin family protein C1